MKCFIVFCIIPPSIFTNLSISSNSSSVSVYLVARNNNKFLMSFNLSLFTVLIWFANVMHSTINSLGDLSDSINGISNRSLSSSVSSSISFFSNRSFKFSRCSSPLNSLKVFNGILYLLSLCHSSSYSLYSKIRCIVQRFFYVLFFYICWFKFEI